MADKPNLFFYCQHSLGMGHLVRALTLAESFAEKFSVLFLNGGRFPDNMIAPADVEIINLPPLGMAENNQLYSHDEQYTLREAQALRKQLILRAFETYLPEVIVIELFPFGRKKFAGELLPLLRAAKRRQEARPLVFCSLRDIMVNARMDQVRHDDRARWLIDRYYDGVLVHSDPKFASLEESFRPTRPLRIPVHYTGFVLPRGEGAGKVSRRHRMLVSAGGGMVGMPLFEIAVKAQPILWERFRLPMTLIAGPFLPEDDWLELKEQALSCPGLTLFRSVPHMTELLAGHSVSLSQCGYNTVMDLLKSGISALVVPFFQGQEDEQTNRAIRLSQLGLLRMIHASDLNVDRLVDEVDISLNFKPNPAGLLLDGADETTNIINEALNHSAAKSAQKVASLSGISHA